MSKHTYKERLVAGLKAKGWNEIASRSGKYSEFTHKETSHHLFIGGAGAMRAGPSASNSHSIGCPSDPRKFYLEILDAGDQVLDAVLGLD